MADKERRSDQQEARSPERRDQRKREDSGDDVEDPEVAPSPGAFDQRAPGVERMVDLVDLLIGQVVQCRCADVARGECDGRQQLSPADT